MSDADERRGPVRAGDRRDRVRRQPAGARPARPRAPRCKGDDPAAPTTTTAGRAGRRRRLRPGHAGRAAGRRRRRDLPGALPRRRRLRAARTPRRRGRSASPPPPAGSARSSSSAGSARTPTTCRAHLRSRREVERLLGESGVPVTVLRAAIVVGAGGISWEMTRQLVKNLPAMVVPEVGRHPHPADRASTTWCATSPAWSASRRPSAGSTRSAARTGSPTSRCSSRRPR